MEGYGGSVLTVSRSNTSDMLRWMKEWESQDGQSAAKQSILSIRG